MKDDRYTIICLILIIAILGIILFFKASGNLNFTQDEETTVSKTEIEINNIKESINMIVISLKIDDTINDEKTCRTLVNYQLKNSTNYQIDENGDVLQKDMKVTNADGTVLNAIFSFEDHSPKVSFNI